MHDDDEIPPIHQIGPMPVLRHFDQGISLREMLHGTLDRLLDKLVTEQETMGAAAVTILSASGETDKVFGGRTVMLALDLDPQGCPGCEHCEGGEGHSEA